MISFNHHSTPGKPYHSQFTRKEAKFQRHSATCKEHWASRWWSQDWNSRSVCLWHTHVGSCPVHTSFTLFPHQQCLLWSAAVTFCYQMYLVFTDDIIIWMGKLHLLVVPCRLFLPLLISPRLPGCTRWIFVLSFLSERHAAPSSPVLLWLPSLHLPRRLEQSSGSIYLFKYWRIVYVLATVSSFCVIIAFFIILCYYSIINSDDAVQEAALSFHGI